MTSETTTTAPTQAVKWADTEKIALLISVIKTSGAKVKWADVSVPAGRTTQSAAKMYSEMMKASAAVAMTNGADITPSKKRARKNASAAAHREYDDGAATPTKKKTTRVRKSKLKVVSPVEDDEEEGEEEEGPSEKKVKVEAKDEAEWGEDGINGELDSQESDATA